MSKTNTGRKFVGSIVAVVMLAICLCITTYAIVASIVGVENSLFHTGRVEINLNDGKPVIDERECLFAPGVTAERKFFIENKSSCDVYFKLYFANVSGGLSGTLEITVSDGSGVLYRGTADTLNRGAAGSGIYTLKVGERRELTIDFDLPEATGNAAQGQTLTFDLCADAVQTKNNPDRKF